MKLSDTPRRIGDIYCSPRCGNKCTWAAYEKAIQESSALAEQLGDGWHPRVWENLGWHWSVHDEDRYMHVYPRRSGGYHTLFSPDSGVGGRPGWSGEGETPEEAIAMSRAAALDEVVRLSRVLDIQVLDADGNQLTAKDAQDAA